jgi:hypothetical protein
VLKSVEERIDMRRVKSVEKIGVWRREKWRAWRRMWRRKVI